MAQTEYNNIANDNFAQAFETTIKAKLQAKSQIKPYMLSMKNTSAESTTVYTAAGLTMQKMTGGPGAKVPAVVGKSNSVKVTLERFGLTVYYDELIDKATAYPEGEVFGESVGYAVDRHYDAINLEAWSQDKNFDAGSNIVDNDGVLTQKVIRKAAEILKNNGAMDEDCFFAVNPAGASQVLELAGATSRDYSPFTPLVDGTLRKFLGFQWVEIPEGGVATEFANGKANPVKFKRTGSGNDTIATFIAWNRNAVAFAKNGNVTTRWQDDATEQGISLTTTGWAGAEVIETQGIVKITAKIGA